MTATEELAAAYPATPDSVGVARRAVVAWARRHSAHDVLLGDIALAVSEACTNVVQHAYDGGAGALHVLAQDTGDGMRVVVADEGHGMRPRPDSPGLGLGLPIVAQLARSVEVRHRDGGGTEVCMTFAQPSP